MSDAMFDQLDAMLRNAEDYEARIFDVVEAMGSDIAGLRLLVDRYGRSNVRPVTGSVAIMLSRAAWNWEPAVPALCDVVLDFLRAVGRGTDAGVLATICNALRGLDTDDILDVSSERQAELGAFLLWCLDQDRFEAPTSCMDLIDDLHSQGRLHRVLPATAVEALKERLARLAAEDREDLRSELQSLRDFWMD